MIEVVTDHRHPVDFVLKMEGGFINDPRDPGGATNYGISLRFLKGIDPQFADLDQDGDIDEDDIYGMTEKEARRFYVQFFYFPMSIFEFLPGLGTVILDGGVNLGKKRSIKLLQFALQRLGMGLKADGILGPITKSAILVHDSGVLMEYVLLERVFYYVRLCEKHPDLKRFLFGWIRRVQALDKFAKQFDEVM